MKDDVATSFIADLYRSPESYPDRVVGIVLGAIIDDRLTDLVKSRIHQRKWKDDPFRDGGVLGSFGARSELAYMLGAISIETLEDLSRIVKIRNAFAHKVGAKDFGSQPVCDLLHQIKIPDRHFILEDLEHGAIWDLGDPKDITPKTPRERFIRTIQLLNGLIFLQISQFTGDVKQTPRF